MFSNDLANLKYEKIQQFDAVYLNNTVGMIFVDPEVREGLAYDLFARAGDWRGITGQATPPWIGPEFGEMIGTKWGVHREPTEQAADPNGRSRIIR